MKCNSCSQDIPAKFVYALSTNTCPFCGQNIMDQVLQEAILTITETFKDARMFADELFVWLKSNYNLISLQEHEEALSLLRVELESVSSQLPGKHKIGKLSVDAAVDGEAVLGDGSKFAKNAGVKIKPSMKELVAQIQANGGGVDDSPMMLDNGEDPYVYLANPGDSHDISNMDAEHDPDLMNHLINRGGNSDYNSKDMMRLKILADKAQHARDELSMGGSVGKIRR